MDKNRKKDNVVLRPPSMSFFLSPILFFSLSTQKGLVSIMLSFVRAVDLDTDIVCLLLTQLR
jgi:hypothetical protein